MPLYLKAQPVKKYLVKSQFEIKKTSTAFVI